MKKTLLAVALSSLSLAAAAQEWRFAPALKDASFKFEPTIAATVGAVKPNGGGETATAYGVELNFNCGLIQSPDNRIRTHLTFSQADEDDYDATMIELSPRYTVPLANGFSVGVGPSIGAVRVNPAVAGMDTETMFAYGLVAGVNYRSGAFYAGLDFGVRRTDDKNGIDYDSRGATLKVGYNF